MTTGFPPSNLDTDLDVSGIHGVVYVHSVYVGSRFLLRVCSFAFPRGSTVIFCWHLTCLSGTWLLSSLELHQLRSSYRSFLFIVMLFIISGLSLALAFFFSTLFFSPLSFHFSLFFSTVCKKSEDGSPWVHTLIWPMPNLSGLLPNLSWLIRKSDAQSPDETGGYYWTGLPVYSIISCNHSIL